MKRTKTIVNLMLMLPVLACTLPGHASDTPRAVAEAYFDATTTSDLDAAGSLFAGTSSVYETGGVEGVLSTYSAEPISGKSGST